MDKNKFGQVRPCLPYLPLQKVWTFWNKEFASHFILVFLSFKYAIVTRILDVKLPHLSYKKHYLQ